MPMRANIISAALVVIPTLCYAGVAWNEWTRANGPMCVTFTGYAFANIGLIWGLWK